MGTEAAAVHMGGHIGDIEGDGHDDMVLHFRVSELGIPDDTPGKTNLTLILKGKLYDGTEFDGTQEVWITPNNSNSGKGKGPKK